MKKSYNECMFYDPSLGTNVFVVDQRTGKQTPITYKASSFFTFHHANAFEKDGNLVVDYCRMRKPDIFQAFSLESMRKGNFLNTDDMDRAAYLARMVIPLSISKDAKVGDDLLKGIGPYGKGCSAVLRENNTIFLEDVIITGQSFEFPRYNYDHYNLREYRYVYGSSILKYETNLAGIVKADLIDRMNVKIWHRENQSQLCAEPVFMPDPNGKEEDDGIVVCPVMIMNGKENPFVLVLNAKDLKEMCRYIIPQDRIPFGFHSMFVQRPHTH
ncbi:hypothetical protein WR25_17259 [Diploscapter pachys]|uniref:Uncharacterized protein n=1 Tax=Diploscapter pachys TaxID=2018661 RepID=A0A2A2L0T3_9BILA|nr:hypothetical protein WR25_17259 [Diploscapter pachys]